MAFKDGRGSGLFSASLAPGAEGSFRAWCNVAVALAVTMLLVGSTYYSFGLFIKPTAAEFRLGRGEVNLGLGFFQIGAAAFAPFVGRIADRYPAGIVIALCGLVFGCGLLTIGLSSSLPLIAFTMAVPMALCVSAGPIAGVVLVSRSFAHLRGRALTIAALGTSAGGLVTFPINAFLVSHFGWRHTLIIVGASTAVLVILMSLLIRHPARPTAAGRDTEIMPAAEALKPLLPASVGRAWTIAELARTADFWLIAIAIALMLAVESAVLTTIPPYAADRNFTTGEATLLMTAATFSAIIGKLTIAWFIDNVDMRVLIGMTGLFAVVLCLSFLFNPTFPVLIAACALTGLAVGGTYPLSNAIVAARFGVISLGMVRGLMMPLSSLLAAASLYAIGAVHDREGSYNNAFALMAFTSLAAVILISFVGRPPRAADAPQRELQEGT